MGSITVACGLGLLGEPVRGLGRCAEPHAGATGRGRAAPQSSAASPLSLVGNKPLPHLLARTFHKLFASFQHVRIFLSHKQVERRGWMGRFSPFGVVRATPAFRGVICSSP
ncbi:hypothetical protein VULLAG_LOCUS2161 [Vulpes lagopus]